jgi:tRNA A37 threonylcarbamoyladenosine synthetase subunit TsaC/SUA5/YrdC
MDVIEAGGVVAAPLDTGYSLTAGSNEPLRRIFDAKRRGGHKRNAMACDLETQRELMCFEGERQEMIEAITVDANLPLGVIGPFNPSHPLMRKLDEEVLRASTAAGTLAVLLNAGPFHAELCRLSREREQPLLGSSANITGTGAKYLLEDVPEELISICDMTVNYGLRKYHTYRRSGTLINFVTMQVIRIGVCYELISDVLKRQFGVELPPDPGLDSLPSGHIDEFMLRDVE